MIMVHGVKQFRSANPIYQGGNTMKRLHKAAAALFAAAILCSFSVFAFAAEDDWGDEWETEEISAAETQESSQQSHEPEKDSSVPDSSVVQDISSTGNSSIGTVSDTFGTGDNTAAGVLAVAVTAAASAAVAGAAVKRRKKTV